MEPDLKTKVESPEVIVIDCDDDEPTLSDKNLRRKSLKKKKKVTLNNVDNLETIHITQNVHLKKQKIKCVINLNANVSDSKREKVELNCHNKSERIVPKCFRPICQPAISDILFSKNRCCNHKPQSTRGKNHKKKSDQPKKSSSRSKSKKEKDCKEFEKKKSKKGVKDPSFSLSSVSLSPFVSDISYEDISLDSFTSCSDDEIDTLITRARERERRMCVTPERHFENPLYTSTPRNVKELSSDEETLKANESIHSLETYVLESHLDYMPYSPTDNYDIPSGCIEECEKNSNFKNSVPTIDLTDTKSDSTTYFHIKNLSYFVNNNSIESKTKVNYTDKNMLQQSEKCLQHQVNCKKIELKTECLKTLSELIKPTEYKPNIAQMDMKVNNLKMPCSTLHSLKNNITMETKIKRSF